VKDDRVYLLHIQEAIARIREYSTAGKEFFGADYKTQDAVIRNLEIIGEAAKNLSDRTKAGRPEIPWKQIGGMRDKLIHHYFGVNLSLVWDTITQDLPKLEGAVAALLVDR
jgi:uncharacterized protein with HEPN domain